MATPTASLPEDSDISYRLVTTSWIECGISLIFVGLRTFTRAHITHNVGRDDWLMSFAGLMILVSATLCTVNATLGSGRHIYYLSTDQRAKVFELNFVAEFVCVAGLVAAQLSVVVLIMRTVAPDGWRRTFLRALSVVCVLVAITIFLMLILSCQPTKALWYPVPAKCLDERKVVDLVAACYSFFAFVDLVLALLPVPVICRLAVCLRTKIRLCCLMGLGVLACACGVVKVTKIGAMIDDPDKTWNTQLLVIWATTEMNVIVWTASIPICYPLWVKLCRNRPRSFFPSRHSARTLVEPFNRLWNKLQPAETNAGRGLSGAAPNADRMDSTNCTGFFHPEDDSDTEDLAPNRIRRKVDFDVEIQLSHLPKCRTIGAGSSRQNLVGNEA